jgi:hypothetical protein
MPKRALAVALALTAMSMSGQAWAQPAKPPPKPGAAPKAAATHVAGLPRVGAHPDFSGVWSVMNTANYDLLPHLAKPTMALRPGPVVPVPAKEVVALGAVGAVPAGMGVVEGGEIPYKPEALAQKQDNQAHWLERDPEIKCYLPGVPRANYMALPFQIFQSPSAMMVAYEYDGAVRNLLFKDPGPPPADSWMGQSVAHWEGDDLVVTVTGLNDSTWFDRAGDFHSDQLTVVERWRMIDANTIRYEATITDPGTFTRPWKMAMNLYRRRGEDAQLGQFKCVQFVEELIYGKVRKEPLP